MTEKWTPVHNTRFKEVRIAFGKYGCVTLRDAIVWTLPGVINIAQYGQNLPSLTLMDGDADYFRCGDRLAVLLDKERV